MILHAAKRRCYVRDTNLLVAKEKKATEFATRFLNLAAEKGDRWIRRTMYLITKEEKLRETEKVKGEYEQNGKMKLKTL